MANDVMLPIYQRVIAEIEAIEAQRGGWAALWQADTLHDRLHHYQLDAELHEWTHWANAFRSLRQAMMTWGSTPITRPDPRVADIVRLAFEAANQKAVR